MSINKLTSGVQIAYNQNLIAKQAYPFNEDQVNNP
jgi:hypothetical protein